MPTYAASVVASVNGTPITDADVTARVALMNKQGKISTDNRRVALQNIIDDSVKIAYAQNFNAVPDDDTVNTELQKMNLGELSETERAMAISALRAEIAWQIVVARTILPTVDVTDAEIATERNNIAREQGLPIEMTIIRLVDIPADVAAKLTKPANCDDAMQMARDLGGAPQKFTALQYELAADIRERVVNLPRYTWSPVVDRSVLLVCDAKKTDEYGKLDDVIKQNTLFKQSMFIADQQLKQLRHIQRSASFAENAPMAILVCGNEEKAFSREKEGWSYVDIDCSAATQNLLLAAHAEGLGACWCGATPMTKPIAGLKEYFKLPENIKPFSIVVLGYPAEESKLTGERYNEERIHWGKW